MVLLRHGTAHGLPDPAARVGRKPPARTRAKTSIHARSTRNTATKLSVDGSRWRFALAQRRTRRTHAEKPLLSLTTRYEPNASRALIISIGSSLPMAETMSSHPTLQSGPDS